MVNFPEEKEDIHFKRKVLMIEKVGHRVDSISLGNFLHADSAVRREWASQNMCWQGD